MVIRRRDKSGDGSSRPTYSSLGSRIEHLLRLAEEQHDQIIAEARHEAAQIVDEARSQAQEILANARAEAGQLTGGPPTTLSAGQEAEFPGAIDSPRPPVT